MHFEVEEKFPVKDRDEFLSRLAELNVSFDARSHQVDHYFSHPSRDFEVTDEALRIRQIGEKNFITYKGPRVDQSTKTRSELDIPVPEGLSTVEQFMELFKALGFINVGVVEKKRNTALVEWNKRQFEVVLDEVVQLGTFVEIECIADEDGLERARADLSELATQIGLNSSERRSYFELLQAQNG